MLNNIEDTLHKTCLIGLSYFNVQGEQLKQNILAGRVINVDSEAGITVELFTNEQTANAQTNNNKDKTANFILPSNLSCWFTAPQGEFHTSQKGVGIINPDYLITWDIYQSKADEKDTQATDKSPQDSEQQWWQWRPNTQSPKVGR
ncbi:MAG: hypothetical protein COB83_08600 [Gammaproteobacteria bacterium]|nr:MAG: hypothetical protein COB83_08600 [Gammaproteobacteria bacterium]